MSKISPDMEKSIIDFLDEYPTKKEGVEAFNEHWGTDFHYRTITQRYNNMKKGIVDALDENYEAKQLERLSKAQTRAMIEQKKAVFMKRDVHSLTREAGLIDIIIDEVRKNSNIEVKKEFRRTKEPIKPEVLEFIISDEHFTGEKDEVLDNVFNAIYSDIYFRGIENPEEFTEFRLTFLGDNIEGMAAHKSQIAVAKMVKPTLLYANMLANKINQLYDSLIKDYPKMEFTVAFVPESNHGQIRPLSSQRSEFPEEDMGYVIENILSTSLNENIYMYEAENGVVKTHDTFYLHGHQGFAKGRNFDKIVSTLGNDRDVVMGHFHHLETHQKGNNLFLLAPAAKSNHYDYEKQGGFNSSSAILKVRRARGRIEEWKLIKL